MIPTFSFSLSFKSACPGNFICMNGSANQSKRKPGFPHKGKLFLFAFSGLFILINSIVWGADLQGNESRPVDPYRQAEYYFHSGDFEKARPLYEDYFNRNPLGAGMDRVLFRLGQMDQAGRSFATALRYYQILIKDFPGSSLMNEVRFRLGECYFELGQAPEAERLFREVTRTHPDIQARWKALYFLGKLDEQRFDYVNALDKFRRVYDQNENPEVRGYAREVIEKIIEEKLPEGTLVSLANQNRSGFPSDLFLLKLLSIYRNQRDIVKYRSASLDFSSRFPNHPEKAKIEKILKALPEKNAQIRLGVVLPLTGKLAVTGQQVLQGIQLAYNQLGFEDKGKLELVVKDSAPAGALTGIVESLAGDPDVVGILGPVQSDEVREIAPVVEQYRIPVFTPTASAEGIPELSPYIFRNALTREIQARFLAEYSINQLNLRRFAILYPLESFGLELRDFFKQEVEAFGGEIVASVAYDRSQTDFRAQILELGGIPDDQLKTLTNKYLFSEESFAGFGGNGKLSKPVVDMGLWRSDEIEDLKASLELNYDAIFIPGFFDKVGLIVPQLAFYNIDSVTLLGANGWNSPKLVETAGKYIREGFFVDGFFAGSGKPEVQKFVIAFKANFGKEPTLHAAQAYDSANIMLKTILQGADTREKVKERLDALRDFPGISGKTTLLPTGDSEKELFTLRIKKRKVYQVN